MKMFLLIGFVVLLILVILFIVTFPKNSINSMGWAFYGGGFLLICILLYIAMMLIYLSGKCVIIKYIRILIGIAFVSGVFWLFKGETIIENLKNGIFSINVPKKYAFWYDYIYNISRDNPYMEMYGVPKKTLEWDDDYKQMFINGSSNMFFSKKGELIVYYNAPIDKLIVFRKIGEKGFTTEKLLIDRKEKNFLGGLFLGDYYVNLDENFYHTWLVDNDTIPRALEAVKTEGFTATETTALLQKIKEKATYYYFKNIDEHKNYANTLYEYPREGNYKVVFFIDGKWQMAQLYCVEEDFATLKQERGVQPSLRASTEALLGNSPTYGEAKRIKPMYVMKSKSYVPSEEEKKSTDPNFDNTQEVEVFLEIHCLDRISYLKALYLMPKNYKKFLTTPHTYLKKGDGEMEIFYNDAIYTHKDWDFALYFRNKEVYFIRGRNRW